MNYTELKQSIQDYAGNTEASFVSHIADFVRMTEKRIYIDADLPVARASVQTATTIGLNTVDLAAIAPSFLSVDSFAVIVAGSHRYIDNKDAEYLRTAFPNSSTQGVPRLYTVDTHETLVMAPTPDAVYTIELQYMRYPDSMVDTNTSWLGGKFDQALLYGSMRDAAIYLKEEADVIAMYETKYTEALGQVVGFGEKRASVDKYRKRS